MSCLVKQGQIWSKSVKKGQSCHIFQIIGQMAQIAQRWGFIATMF